MNPSPLSIRLAVPDHSFRLSSAERASIQPTFDADALERLLARIQPDKRREILVFFQISRPKGLGNLAGFTDPELQPLLEEVWAPLWENAMDQEIEDDVYGLPGRGVVKERRARARGQGARREGHVKP